MKKIIAGLVALLVVAAGGYFIYSKTRKSTDKKYVTEAVKRGDITASVSETGRLDAKVSVLVGTEVSGTIREIDVDYNSVVKKGQVLLKLDQDLFRAQVEQQMANVKSAEAHLGELVSGKGMTHSGVVTDIDQKKAQLEKAKADYDRSKELLKRGIIAQQDLDTMKSAYLVADAQLKASESNTAKDDVTGAQIEGARASVRQARATLLTANTNLSKTVIKAPMDGVVIDKTVEVGQTVAASFSTPNLLTIGDLLVMQVTTSIDEADVGQVAVGQEAEFTVDAFPHRVFKGNVSKVYYAPVTVQNVVTYSGIIEVQNPERILRPGMTANVKIITSRKKGVLTVPSSALRVVMDVPYKEPKGLQRGTRTVWVMRGEKPSPVQVKVGVTDFTNTEIVSGLKEGDVVVVDTAQAAGGTKNHGQTQSRPGGGMRM